MKRFIVFALVLTGLFSLPLSSSAQTPQLSLSAVGFPDTAHVNQSYDFSFILTNVSPANTFSGAVHILYTTDTLTGDTASFGVNQTGGLAPFDTFAIHITNFSFDPNNQPQFSTGDNVVVVWPAIGGDNLGGDSIILHVFIPDPAGVDDKSKVSENPIRITKPGKNLLGVSITSQENIVEQVRIYSLSGQLLLDEKGQEVLNLSGIPTGVYIIEVSSNGEKLYQKFFKN